MRADVQAWSLVHLMNFSNKVETLCSETRPNAKRCSPHN